MLRTIRVVTCTGPIVNDRELISDPCQPRASAAKFVSRIALCLLGSTIAASLTLGCSATKPLNWETLKGPGFPGWSESIAGRARPGGPVPKASGFFTDRRSEQIEQDLGGF